MSTTRRFLPAVALAVLLAACGGTGVEPGGPAVSNSETAPATEPTGPAASESAPTTEPATSEPDASDPVAADCSAAGLDLDDGAFLDLTEDARATAELILDAALRCDEQILATAAFESETGLTFGNADPYEFFGLPEQPDAQVYEVIARLLAETQPDVVYSEDYAIWVWPAVATAASVDDDNAWQDLADSGLYTADEIEELRTQSDGYLGWRIGIADDGTWQYLVAGD
jgi:hypothetical protein